MANESNLKKKKRKGEKIVRQVGGLAASYFVSKYLAEIIPVCRKSGEKDQREKKERKREKEKGRSKRIQKVQYSCKNSTLIAINSN